jgi:hypothetical protein
MTDIASDLKAGLDYAAYFYLSAWEHDPQTVIKDNAITERDPAREDHEIRMIEIFEGLRDSVDAIPLAIISKTKELRTAIGPEKYEALLIEATRRVGRTSFFKDASEFLEMLNSSMQSAS